MKKQLLDLVLAIALLLCGSIGANAQITSISITPGTVDTICGGTSLELAPELNGLITGQSAYINSFAAGGGAVTCNCPTGYVAVGYTGRSGSWLDQFSLACKQLNSDGTLGSQVVYTSHNGNSTGGSADGPYLLGGNNVLVGLSGDESYYSNDLSGVQGYGQSVTYVDTMGDNTANATSPGFLGNGYGFYLGSVYAPAGSVVTGMVGWNTGFAAGFSLVYTRISQLFNSYLWSTGDTTPVISVNTAGSYSVSVTPAGSSTPFTASASVVVDTVVINASGSTILCYGDSVTLTSTAGNTYQWSDGETTQGITLKTGGNYTVTTNGCAAIYDADVVVHPAPFIATNGPSTFCPGFSLQLFANPTGSYLWSTGQTSDTISVNTAGTFTVSITDTFGCSLDTFITTQVSSLPAPQLTSGDDFFYCSYFNTTDVEVSNPSPLYATYRWSDGTTGQQDNVASTGEVYVTISDALGCTVTDSADIVSGVYGNPAVFGQNVWNVYAWNAGDGTIDSNDWNTQYSGYYVDTNLAFNSTNYWCNYCYISSAPGYQGCPTGLYNMSYSAERQGFPCGYYRIDIPGHDDGAQLFVNDSLVWSAPCCTPNIDNVWRGFLDGQSKVMFRICQGPGYTYGIMAITPLPNDSLIFASAPTTFCPGFGIQLSAGNAGSYSWSTGETTQTITVSTAGAFAVTISDASCNLNLADTIVTTVQPLPVPQLSGAYCSYYNGANVLLINPSPLYAGYLWSDSTTNASDFVSDTGEVYVTISDVLGCTVAGSIDIISGAVGDPSVYGQGVWNVYAWNAGDAPIDSNDWSKQYAGYYVDTNLAFNSTNYWCNTCAPSNAQGYQGCPVGQTNISYSAQRQGFQCGYYRIDIPYHDDAAQLFINGALVWVDSGCCDVHMNVWRGVLDANTQVMFRVSQGGGPTDGIMAITALPTDSLITASGPLTFCPGYAIQLTAIAGSNYLWNTGATTQTITDSTGGRFTVEINNGCHLKPIAAIITSVMPLAIPQIGGGYCSVSNGANLYLNNPSPFYATYQWGDGTTNATDFVSDTGEVYVTVSDALGCTASDSTDVGSGIVGNPAVYGQGVWNVYAWDAGDAAIDANDWNQNYSGYYVDTNLAYNSNNYWCSTCAPSQAPGYQGCPVGLYNISYSAQRQGFPCGYYRIDIPAHDDAAQLFINGALVWVDSGCCDVNLNVWRGLLDANTQVMFRITQGGGATDGIMAITPLLNDSIIIISGATNICTGQSVVLTGQAAASYLWNTGATTQSITVSSTGSYSITLSNGGACSVTATVPVTVILPAINGCPQNTVVASQPGICGAIVSFDTPTAADVCSGLEFVSFAYTGAYQTWTVPANVYSIQIDAAGATGGGSTYNAGGNGARAQTTLAVTPGQALYINVGGAGNGTTAGYNGGGGAACGYYGCSGGGGGFTAVGTTGTLLTDTLVVVAGGGGAGVNCGNEPGGAGGGPNGTAGLSCGSPDGGGATQTGGGASQSQPGSFMQGGNGVEIGYYSGGGGGGGYYGGGGGTGGGGGGGSSYVSGVGTSNTTYTAGYNGNGNGYVNISYGAPFNAVQTAGLPSGSTFPVGTTTVTFTATDSVGGSSSCSFTVTVNPTPVSTSASICEGNSYNFDGVLLTQAGLYTDTIASSGGCDSIIHLTLTVNPVPISIITVTGATTFCPGGHVTLTASTGSSYLWSTGATTKAIVVTTSGNYAVTVYNSFGCGTGSLPITVNASSNPVPVITTVKPTTFCQGGNVVLTASTGASYLWNTGAATKSITVTTSGSYIVTVTLAGGCSGASSPEVVTVNPLPTATVSAGGTTAFCSGGSVTLSASTGSGYSYLWNKGETTSSITATTGGNYKVTVTNANGCKAASAITKVTVHDLPNATITAGSSTELCNGDSVKLTAKPGLIWNWSTGATTRIITVRTPDSYDVTVTNKYECSKASAPTVVTECLTADDKTSDNQNDGNTSSSAATLSNGDFNVSVYPNPYTGQFNLKVLSSSTGNINVKIFDITGKLLEERKEVTYGTDLILGYGYAAGVYLIQVNQADVTRVIRIVKAE